MRDDFSLKTKEELAHRAGYRCSKPDCGIPTRGAASDDQGTINIGFAAHITGASPKGPRFVSTLTSDQRKHHTNGIWLCGTHAKLVDSDEAHFTVEELVSWKKMAERRSFLEVVSCKPSPVGALLADNGDVQTAVDLLIDYSKLDLSAFKRMPGWPSHAIALALKMVDCESADVFTASGLASAIEVFDEIAVIAPPGTGKTTTLLQVTEAILNNASSVAAFVPLSEWSTRSDTFFQSLLRRASFRDARERQLELLAGRGRLVLILDGWNELDVASKRRVRNDIKSLRRDFPDIRLVVSSRHKDFDIPINGPVVEVERSVRRTATGYREGATWFGWGISDGPRLANARSQGIGGDPALPDSLAETSTRRFSSDNQGRSVAILCHGTGERSRINWQRFEKYSKASIVIFWKP